MSLRTRLFLLIGGLAAVLVGAQWWLVRTLTHDVTTEVGHVAFRVGEGIVTSLGLVRAEHGADGAPTSTSAPAVSPPAEWQAALPHPVIVPPGAKTVTEREIRLREVDGKLEIVDERVRVGQTSSVGPLPAQGGDMGDMTGQVAPAGEARNVVVMLSVDRTADPNVLRVGGPSSERQIPIPRAGVEEALETFRRRLLAGSAGLLAAGLALAAVIAHRATAPLRELSSAARAVGDGALGTQVPHAGAGEVGDAVVAFNLMSRRLAELDADAKRLREREHLHEVGEIARGLAHGLRNPLNALGLTVDELAAGSPERAPLAESARRQIRRIDQSVRSFLALAASSSSAPDESVDVVAIVQDVALEALQDARGRVSVGVQAGDDVPRVLGVPAELRAVAQALVVNAVEASPSGARVAVRVERLGETGGVKLVVEDQGPGLPDTVRGKLFTPHVTTKANGSGMGLYLAHRIVTARHGGTLALQPGESGGTRAIAEIPARATEA